MDTLNRWPDMLQNRPPLIVLPITEAEIPYAFNAAQFFRDNGIRCDIYPDTGKFKKAMKYASDRTYQFTAICGESESIEGKLTLKNMDSGQQQLCSWEEALALLKSC
jgi:histidyl-tRNA synthetase